MTNDLNLGEQLARIDRALAAHARIPATLLMRLPPWALTIAGMIAGAVLFAAGAAFLSVFGG